MCIWATGGIGRGILSQRSDTAAKGRNWQGPEDVVFARCEDYCCSSSGGGRRGERCVLADGDEFNRVCWCVRIAALKSVARSC